MAIANCARCGHMYQKFHGVRLCPDCIQAEEDAFLLVREYVELNPQCTLESAAEAVNIDPAMILRFLRDGRLGTRGELAHNLKVECVKCGMPIGGGKYCTKCMDGLGQEFSDATRQAGETGKPDNPAARLIARTRRAESIEEKRRLDSSSS